MRRVTPLFEVIHARDPLSCHLAVNHTAGRQSGQERNDGRDNEQFQQRERGAFHKIPASVGVRRRIRPGVIPCRAAVEQ